MNEYDISTILTSLYLNPLGKEHIRLVSVSDHANDCLDFK